MNVLYGCLSFNLYKKSTKISISTVGVWSLQKWKFPESASTLIASITKVKVSGT